MAESLVFPTRLFGPQSVRARIVGQAISGGVSLSGEEPFDEIAGGGMVVAEFGDVILRDRAKMLAWRRLFTAADGGAQPVLVPLGDRRHQPVNPHYTGADTFGLTDWVADASAWAAEEVTATTTADAALGATSLSMTFTAPLPLLGGEAFSVCHPTWGWRVYWVSRVTAGGLGTGDPTTIKFRTPLREAVPSGTALNFESPRFVARVDGDLSATLDALRFGKGQARFIEYPGPPA